MPNIFDPKNTSSNTCSFGSCVIMPSLASRSWAPRTLLKICRKHLKNGKIVNYNSRWNTGVFVSESECSNRKTAAIFSFPAYRFSASKTSLVGTFLAPRGRPTARHWSIGAKRTSMGWVWSQEKTLMLGEYTTPNVNLIIVVVIYIKCTLCLVVVHSFSFNFSFNSNIQVQETY